MRPSATRSSCRRAPFPNGRPRWCCRRTLVGSTTTLRASEDSSATASMCPSPGCSSRPLGPPAPDANGADRARSASEAFLYRRLETLPETKGCFRINAELPIAFDGDADCVRDFLHRVRDISEHDLADCLGRFPQLARPCRVMLSPLSRSTPDCPDAGSLVTGHRVRSPRRNRQTEAPDSGEGCLGAQRTRGHVADGLQP